MIGRISTRVLAISAILVLAGCANEVEVLDLAAPEPTTTLSAVERECKEWTNYINDREKCVEAGGVAALEAKRANVADDAVAENLSEAGRSVEVDDSEESATGESFAEAVLWNSRVVPLFEEKLIPAYAELYDELVSMDDASGAAQFKDLTVRAASLFGEAKGYCEDPSIPWPREIADLCVSAIGEFDQSLDEVQVFIDGRR